MSDAALPPPVSMSHRVAWLIFAAAVSLAVVRAPQLLVEPRFWAEEGTLYYVVARREPVLDSLFHLPPRTAAYLALQVSAPATFAAHVLPVELAPFATTYSAFALVVIALAIVVFGRSTLWNDPIRKGLACLVVLAAPSNLGEVWLTSTNAWVYCGVIAFCILCEDLRRASWTRIALYAVLLAVTGLSGVYTAFLSFAFAWKLWVERSRGAWVTAGVVALTSVRQVAAFLWMWARNVAPPTKLQALDWVRSAIFTFYSQVVTPLGLRPFVQGLFDADGVVLSLQEGQRLPAIVGFAIASLLGLVGFVAAFVDRDPRSPRNGLVLAFASVAALTTLSANFGRTTGRYAVLSGICLLWLLLAHTVPRAGAHARVRAVAAGALLAWALAVGVSGYRDDPAFTCPGGCPRWTEEVARWRQDPTLAPQVWPRRLPPSTPQWRVDLSVR